MSDYWLLLEYILFIDSLHDIQGHRTNRIKQSTLKKNMFLIIAWTDWIQIQSHKSLPKKIILKRDFKTRLSLFRTSSGPEFHKKGAA